MEKRFLQLNYIKAYKIAFKDEEYHHILGELQKLPKELNQLINFTNQKLTI